MQILLGLRSFDSWASIAVWCRYANLRRRLLIDPHLSKDEEGAPELIVQNPLPQIRRQTLVLDHCLPDLSLYHTTCLILEPICPNHNKLTVHPWCPLFLSDLIYFEFSQPLANVDHTGSLMYFLMLPPPARQYNLHSRRAKPTEQASVMSITYLCHLLTFICIRSM